MKTIKLLRTQALAGQIQAQTSLTNRLTLALAAVVLCAALRQEANAGAFHWTGAMTTARYNLMPVLLPNGQVLVEGSVGGSGSSSAELYNPTTGTWSLTSPMNAHRFVHTATLLPNGQVLVAGGWSGSGYLSSAELYNPATGTWTATNAMTTPRTGHTATLLPNGKVLVAGGTGPALVDGVYALKSAELYDPATGKWTPTGEMANKHYMHTATLLPNGMVLVAGGENGSALSSAELYNPATGTWTPTGAMTIARDYHTATLLPNGQVLVAGGHTGYVAAGDRFSSLSSAELYNPATGTWTATTAMGTARTQHTATLLPNGAVLVASGQTGTNYTPIASAELYNPATETWTATGDMNTGRFTHKAILLPNDQVLLAGGWDGLFGSLSSAELYVCESTPPQPPTNGLVAYYPFNGNANDASGNGNNGTVYGTTLSTNRFGFTNSAYSFSRTGYTPPTRKDEIYIPYSPTFNTTNITVSVWVLEAADNTGCVILSRFQYGYSTPSGQTWAIGRVAGHGNTNAAMVMAAASAHGGTGNFLYDVQPPPSNTWYQIASTYDGLTHKLFVNGQPVNSVVLGIALNTAGNSGIGIGVSDQANGYWGAFEGRIDDVRIYNRALSASEVQQLYAYESTPPPTITTQPVSQSVNQGSPVSFKVTATGTGLGYQWQWNSVNISGATNASYSLASTTTNDAGTYAVIVSNAGGCVTSSNAVLTVNSTSPPPGFLTNGLVAYYPFNGNANDESGSGNNLSATNVQFLTVNPWIMNPVAALENPVSYMLGQHSLLNGVTNWTWSAWANPTSYTNGLQILFCEANSTEAQTGGSVIVIGLNSRAKLFAVSSWNVGNLPDFWKGAQFPITVSSGFHHFALTLQNGGIDAGTLSLFVDGLPAGSAGHQSVATIPGAPMTVALGEDPSFPLSGRSSAYQYKGEMDSVRIYNRALSTSEVQQLYAYESPASSPPIIASQPVSQNAHQGSSASFNVAATGINLSYQWHLNSVNIPGATNASYSLASATANNAGTYAVIVSNAGGSVTSSNAVLTVIPPFSTATGTATLFGIFVVGANITDGGSGYTNTPIVRFVGGGGSGAQAVAVVSNGMVTAISMLDAGYGYTNAPLFVIDPPFIAHPVLGIAPMSFLSFTNLTVGGSYQLQRSMGWYWADEPVSFTATGGSYTQMVAGVAVSGDYRLALNPVPAQAFATAQLFNGFVVGAAVTSGGSGYVTSPVVNIVGGGGTDATALSHISGGVVTAVSITDAGIGYTNAPTIQIAAPPAAAVSPTVRPVMRVDTADLAPYNNYQIQFKPDLGEAWGNWNGGLFTPTDMINSQYLFITNGSGFFRVQHVP